RSRRLALGRRPRIRAEPAAPKASPSRVSDANELVAWHEMQLRAAVKKLPLATSAYALMRLLLGRKARLAADYRRNSGVGSGLNATRALSNALPSLIRCLSVRSMLDIPCGDFLWMRHIDIGTTTSYIGADIIETLIVSHERLYASDKRTFTVLDIVTDDLPEVDLVFCRDCLPHFSHRLLKKAVNN